MTNAYLTIQVWGEDEDEARDNANKAWSVIGPVLATLGIAHNIAMHDETEEQ